MIQLNKKGKLPDKLEDYMSTDNKKEIVFEDAVGQDSLNRFDKKTSKTQRKPKVKFKKRKGSRDKPHLNRLLISLLSHSDIPIRPT